MDKKEQVIFNHYKDLLEKNEFDEYDVLGFLILIRRHIDYVKYPYLKEYCHLIAHRERNKGYIVNAIHKAKENAYKINKNGSVIGYKGIHQNDWQNELITFFKNFGIIIDKKIIRDFTLCIFSLAQHSNYEIDLNTSGTIELFYTNDGKIGLCTVENKQSSPFIQFTSIGNYSFKREYVGGYICDCVETYRENGILHLRNDKQEIII